MDELRQYTDALGKCDIFQGIEGDALVALLEKTQARVSEYAKGERLIGYGDRVSRMGILLDGTVVVETDDAGGEKINMNMMNPGDEFGGFFIVSGQARSWMNVYAASNCRVLFFDVMKVCRAESRTADEWRLLNNLTVNFSNKCVELYQKVRLYGQKRVRMRLRTYLVELAGDSEEVVLPLNRTQLAAYLGVERTALAREMKRMQEEGIIAVNKRRIRLADRAFFRLDDQGHAIIRAKAEGR